HTPPGKSPPPAQPPRVPGTGQDHTPGCGRTGPPHHRHRGKEEGERTRVRPRSPPPVRHRILTPTSGDDDGAAGSAGVGQQWRWWSSHAPAALRAASCANATCVSKVVLPGLARAQGNIRTLLGSFG